MTRLIEPTHQISNLEIEKSLKSDVGFFDTKSNSLVSIAEYRKILKDYHNTDEIVIKRLEYLEAFTRNIAKEELRRYIIESKQI